VGAILFAVDAQTNLYANASGTVIKLNGDGVPLQTNSICPRPGIALRDTAGNFYFSGIMPGHLFNGIDTAFDPQDFGGVVLSNMPVYIVKYSAAGTLIWATNLGPTTVRSIGVLEFVMDSQGDLILTFRYFLSSSTGFRTTAKFDSNGIPGWTSTVGSGSGDGGVGVRMTPYSSTNFYVVTYFTLPGNGASLRQLDASGSGSGITNWASPFGNGITPPPVILNAAGDLYNVEGNPNVNLIKRTPTGTVRWSVNTGTAQRGVGPDQYDGVHIASDTTNLSRYDNDGNLAWTRSLPAKCLSLLLDSSGNRFLSLSGGIVARLGGETLISPVITNAPVGKKVFTGTNVELTVGASGTTPLRYYWIKDGNFLDGATNATLTLSNPSFTQSGQYSVLVSNHVGSVTSAPVQVVIKAVELFNGSQLLTNGTYSYPSAPTLTVRSAFTNGSSFYTLDGSAPSFASTFYTGPFVVPTNATVRALGYNADFSQSEEADAVNIVLPPPRALTTSVVGPGTIGLNPPGGLYTNSTVVTVTATPSAGWTFLYWVGDVIGTSPSTSVTMNQDKSVQAVFGTTLSTTVAGNGSVQLNPPGGVYPYGSVIRLTGIPQPGNYFGVWGNAASGTANPLYFTLTNPSPTVSSLFAATPAGQAALTVLINGPGTIHVSPAGNVFATNQSVNITAAPLAGQGFLNWSGDATGTQNPITVAMTQSRVVTANFTNWPVLFADSQSLTPLGFRLTVLSGPGLVYQIQGSPNLGTWSNLGVVTNTFGSTQFTDPAGTNLPLRFYRALPWP